MKNRLLYLVLLFVRAGEDVGEYRGVADEVRAWGQQLEGARVSFRPVLVAELADREMDRRVQQAVHYDRVGLLRLDRDRALRTQPLRSGSSVGLDVA